MRGRERWSLDLFRIRDESLLDAESMPEPDVIVEEIAEDLRSALRQIEEILGDLGAPSWADERATPRAVRTQDPAFARAAE